MTMPRKFTDEQLAQAQQLRASGEKWDVVELIVGEGVKNAIYWRNVTSQKVAHHDAR